MGRKGRVICVSVAASLLFIILIVFHIDRSYKSTMESMLPIMLSYNDTVIETAGSLNSDYVSRFTVAHKNLYFGKIDTSQDHIQLKIPGKASITVYPNDSDSVLVDYQQYHGLRLQYKLSQYGNFQKHCEILYEITNNDIFKNAGED